MRTIALAVVFSTLFAASAARANDFVTSDDKTMDSVAADSPRDGVTDAATKDNHVTPPLKLRPAGGSFVGASALRSMYVSLGVLQAYDVYSTATALRHGAVERNPLLQNTVGNRALFIGLKVAMTAGPVYEAEKLWRNHHRIGAIALMAASNGIMMGVAAHNTSVIRRAQASQAIR